MNPAWRWWALKLAGKLPQGAIVDTPQAGFYRKVSKEFYGARKTFMPVAYWPDVNEDGELVLFCREGDKNVGATRAMELWNHVNQHPVSEEAYRGVAQYGKLWPDEHELVPMQKPPGIGHNKPPPDNTPDGLREQIEPLAKAASERIKGDPITSQDECDRVANLADRLAELWNLAESQRKAERKPHDEALKAIQTRWAPVLLMAEVYKNLKYACITPWLKKLETEQKMEALAAAAAGEPAPAEVPRPRAGTRGRAMSLKSTKTAKITNFEACLAFFKDSEDIKSCVQTLANRAVRAGIAVPGCEVEEETKAV